MHVHQIYSYISRKLHTFIFHVTTCITCSSAGRCLRDFRSSSGGFGNPVLVTSVELVQAETECSSSKNDVMMTAKRCSDLTFRLLIIAIVFILNQFYIQ